MLSVRLNESVFPNYVAAELFLPSLFLIDHNSVKIYVSQLNFKYILTFKHQHIRFRSNQGDESN